MQQLKDPKEVVDSLVDGALGAVQFFPRVAENIARVATDYATSANRNLTELKTRMPEEPMVIPRIALGVIGETTGTGIGFIEAIIKAGSDTAADVKSQIRRVTG